MPDHTELSELTDKIGSIEEVEELCLGVHYVTAKREDDLLSGEYYVVKEKSAVPQAAKSYGQKISGLRLFSITDGGEEYKIIQYEVAKYRAQNNLRHSPSRSILAHFRFRSTRREVSPSVIGFWTMESTGWKQTSVRKSWPSAIRSGPPNCQTSRQAWGNRQSTARPMI